MATYSVSLEREFQDVGEQGKRGSDLNDRVSIKISRIPGHSDRTFEIPALSTHQSASNCFTGACDNCARI